MMKKNLSIGILIYPGCLGSEVFGFRDTLEIANALAAASAKTEIDISLFRARRQKVKLSGGETLDCPYVPRPAFDIILVPAFMFVNIHDFKSRLDRLDAETRLLANAPKDRTELVSICGGAFLLGKAGLLTDVRCTTAWFMASLLQKMVPAAKVKANALIVTDGNITTSGAFSAAFDVAIHLIKKFIGADAAQKTLNLGLLDGARTSQGPYADQALFTRKRSDFIAKVENWLVANMQKTYSLENLAHYAAVTPRTLQRRYKKERGMTPLEYLQSERIGKAKELLRMSDRSLQQISNDIGYEDISAFRRLFERYTQTTPGAFRKRFRRPADELRR